MTMARRRGGSMGKGKSFTKSKDKKKKKKGGRRG